MTKATRLIIDYLGFSSRDYEELSNYQTYIEDMSEEEKSKLLIEIFELDTKYLEKIAENS